MEISNNCNHEVNYFGECTLCLIRINNPCEGKDHDWIDRGDNEEELYCGRCGEYEDKNDLF